MATDGTGTEDKVVAGTDKEGVRGQVEGTGSTGLTGGTDAAGVGGKIEGTSNGITGIIGG